jgi:hypothetical protein
MRKFQVRNYVEFFEIFSTQVELDVFWEFQKSNISIDFNASTYREFFRSF